MSVRLPSRHLARRRGRGFTLIEVVAAFSLLAIGLALSMQIATGGMRQARQAAEYTEAALLAQTLLDTVGVGEPIEIGETEGEADGGYRWLLTIAPYESEELQLPEGISPESLPVRLVELELVLSWKRGEREREARYRTLRAMLPESP